MLRAIAALFLRCVSFAWCFVCGKAAKSPRRRNAPTLPQGLSPLVLPVQHGLPVLPVGRFRAACRFRPLSGAVCTLSAVRAFLRLVCFHSPCVPAVSLLLTVRVRLPTYSRCLRMPAARPPPSRARAVRALCARPGPIPSAAFAPLAPASAARTALNKMLTICIHIIVELKAAKW